MDGNWPFTGRGDVIEEIRRVLDGGSHEAVLICAAPGSGKTRVAREVASGWAAAGHDVVWAQGTTAGAMIPLGAFAELAAQVAEHPTQVARDLVRDRLPSRHIVIDDVHLLDPLSLYVVAELVRARVSTLLMTSRTETDPPGVPAGLLHKLDLLPLSRADTVALVGARLDGRLERSSSDRIWDLTRGNLLYLHWLVDTAVRQGGLRRGRFGEWVWVEDPPVIAESVRELVALHMGELTDGLDDVVDVLAVGEPVEVTTLAELASETAVAEARRRSLVTVEHEFGVEVGRLRHPLYGDVRRARAGELRLRRLRGELLAALPGHDRGNPMQTLRCAVLALESDRPGDSELLLDGAAVALTADPPLALRFAEAARERGAPIEGRIAHGFALSLLGDGVESERLLAPATRGANERQRAEIATIRVGNFLWTLADRARATIVAEEIACEQPTAGASLRTVLAATAGAPNAAIAAWTTPGSSDGLPELTEMLAIWGSVIAHTERGEIARAVQAADQGRALAARSLRASYYVAGMNAFLVAGLVAAGQIERAESVARAQATEFAGIPGPTAVWSEAVAGVADAGRGDLASACRRLQTAIEGFHRFGSGGYAAYGFEVTLAQAQGMRGDVARAVLDRVDADPHPAYANLAPRVMLARAWCHASEHALSQAVSAALAAAEHARGRGQATDEVCCLTTAVRFGDTSAARRLVELAGHLPEVPRAAVAAAHAAALERRDPERLVDVSADWGRIGDRACAADAVAQAAQQFRLQGRRGSAAVARERARALADELGVVRTPALSAAVDETSLTPRQHECVRLAAHGLSNKEIARRLGLSVRTVEGHLYRAAEATGVNVRE